MQGMAAPCEPTGWSATPSQDYKESSRIYGPVSGLAAALLDDIRRILRNTSGPCGISCVRYKIAVAISLSSATATAYCTGRTKAEGAES